MSLVELLGSKLITKDGEGETAAVLQGKGAVALYFSAHWCPPCQRFTPMLSNWYSTSLKDKGLEVVFVSSDKDEASFTEYYGGMPWLALPFDSDKKASLDKKFKVQGIPTIIILDSDGNLLNKNGREVISNDPTGEDFPWRQKTLGEMLSSAKIVSASGESSGADLMGKVFAFYFSAHWCPPCRGFTPQLAEWYKNGLKDKGLEVVFVSSDKTEDAFKEYFAEMPWLALDYSDRKLKGELSNMFGVEGIPSMVIIDADGSVIAKDGRSAISADPTGEDFPWYPKPVSNLKGGPGTIQEVPSIIAFCEGSEDAKRIEIENAMTPLATKFMADAKAAGEEEPEIGFAIITEGSGMISQIRSLMQMGDAAGEPKLMILDIPDQGGYYEGPAGAITEDVVAKLVEDYKSKSLERKQLQRS
jgi:nucleoredoxin